MDEREALSLVSNLIPAAGDDAAIVDDLVITTDMLHEQTDFPAETTRYTAGWRAVGASLSDIAATGAIPVAAVGVYAAPTFEHAQLQAFLEGAQDVCTAVNTTYVGGDLDHHDEFTVVSTAIGRADDPIDRAGASPGDTLVVTGPLGRSAAALSLFSTDPERANTLFRFQPRIEAGQALAPHATAMMDSSDGLARSLHQLAARSECGFFVEPDAIPIHDTLTDLEAEPLDRAITFGEDFELLATVDPNAIDSLQAEIPELTVIGEVTENGIMLGDEPLADRGYTHGE